VVWWLRRTATRKARKDLPGDAEIKGKRRGVAWATVLTGVGAALGGVRSSWDEPVWGAVAAGIVTGIVVASCCAAKKAKASGARSSSTCASARAQAGSTAR
jgi:hypothetical protein